MKSSDHQEDEGLAHGYHGLPGEDKRAVMSVMQLAELLSAQEKDSVGYIVLSHELNLKIAKIQAKATLNAGWLGVTSAILASVLTFALGYFVGTTATEEHRSKAVFAAPIGSAAPNSPDTSSSSTSPPAVATGELKTKPEFAGAASTPATNIKNP